MDRCFCLIQFFILAGVFSPLNCDEWDFYESTRSTRYILDEYKFVGKCGAYGLVIIIY